MNPQEWFDKRLEGYLQNPTLQGWSALAHAIVPGTTRTVWQGWIMVDASAPVELPGGHDSWPRLPDPFTVRRAIKAVRDGRVPAGLGPLVKARQKNRVPST